MRTTEPGRSVSIAPDPGVALCLPARTGRPVGPSCCQLEVAIVSTAVVTGPSERVADMALVLRLAGFEVYVPEPDVGQIPIGTSGY